MDAHFLVAFLLVVGPLHDMSGLVLVVVVPGDLSSSVSRTEVVVWIYQESTAYLGAPVYGVHLWVVHLVLVESGMPGLVPVHGTVVQGGSA